jgi:hypothetical protein
VYAARPASALPGEAATAGGAESFGFRINLGLGLAAEAAAADRTAASPPADTGASHGADDLAAGAECGWRPRLQGECDGPHRDELQNVSRDDARTSRVSSFAVQPHLALPPQRA